MNRSIQLLGLLSVLALGGVLGYYAGGGDSPASLLTVAQPAIAASDELAQEEALRDDEQYVVNLFKEASAGTVHINTMARRVDLFRRRAYDVPQGSGSGFIWSKDGINHHELSCD